MQAQVEAADNRVGVVDGDWPDIGQSLDLGSAFRRVSSDLADKRHGTTYTSFT